MPPMEFHAELNAARIIARQAWNAIAPLYRTEIDVRQKPDGPVTEADHLANDIILGELHRQFPRHAILSEETVPHSERLSAECVWIVDPIDGTRDFIDQSGNFAIHIGLAVRIDTGHRPVLGVVYHPTANQLYYAASGCGAWVEKSGGSPLPIRVSPTATATEMTAVFTRSHRTERFLMLLDRLAPRRRISMGSIGLKIIWVAAGRADYFINNARGMCCEWDICAPEAILAEAGGILTDLHGHTIIYNQPSPRVENGILATNGATHDALRRKILETEAHIRSENP